MIIEACLRVVDADYDSLAHSYARTKAGDVIDILPEGSDWGSVIMASSDYRIVRLSLTADQLSELTATEVLPDGVDEATLGRSLVKRTKNINMDNVPQPFAQEIMNNIDTVTDLSTVNIAAITSSKATP